MARTSDTYSRAYGVCDTIMIEEGRFPTIEAVRDRIGTNSPVVIKRAINDWALHYAHRLKTQLDHPKIPSSLLTVAEQLWQTAVQDAEVVFSVQLGEKETAEQAALAQVAALEARLSEREAAWTQHEQAVNEAVREREARIAQYQADYQDLLDQNQTLTHTVNDLKQQQARSEGAFNALQQASDTQAQAWEKKFQQEHAWHLARISDEKALAREAYAKTLQALTQERDRLKTDCELAGAKTIQLTNTLNELFDKHARALDDSHQLRDTLEQIKTQWAHERAQYQPAQSQLKVTRKKRAVKTG